MKAKSKGRLNERPAREGRRKAGEWYDIDTDTFYMLPKRKPSRKTRERDLFHELAHEVILADIAVQAAFQRRRAAIAKLQQLLPPSEHP